MSRYLLAIVLLLSILGLSSPAWSGGPSGFTQADRECLVRMEATLNTFMKATDQRFQDMQQDMNKRFEQVDKRFQDMQQDMNKRFEQVDKRFEQVDKRFEQMMNFMWILASIFTAITVITIGFAFWDRRTMVRKAVDESVDKIECKGSLAQLISVIEDLAKEDPKLMSKLRSRGLL